MRQLATLLLAVGLVLGGCGGDDPGANQARGSMDWLPGSNGASGDSCSWDFQCNGDNGLICRPVNGDGDQQCARLGKVDDLCADVEDCADGLICESAGTCQKATPVDVSGKVTGKAGDPKDMAAIHLNGLTSRLATTDYGDFFIPAVAPGRHYVITVEDPNHTQGFIVVIDADHTYFDLTVEW